MNEADKKCIDGSNHKTTKEEKYVFISPLDINRWRKSFSHDWLLSSLMDWSFQNISYFNFQDFGFSFLIPNELDVDWFILPFIAVQNLNNKFG